jgi:hypothetical protein
VLAIGDGDTTYSCVSTDSNLRTITCTLEDTNQFFVSAYFGNYVSRIFQRSSGRCLTVVNNQVILSDCIGLSNAGYHWLEIPLMNFQQGRDLYTSSAQIGYIGDLDEEVISDSRNYSSPENLRNFIISAGIRVLSNNNQTLTLAQYQIRLANSEDNQDDNGNRYLLRTSCARVGINQLDDTGRILS